MASNEIANEISTFQRIQQAANYISAFEHIATMHIIIEIDNSQKFIILVNECNREIWEQVHKSYHYKWPR